MFQVNEPVTIEESNISPDLQPHDMVLPLVNRPLTKNEMKSKVNSIAHTLKAQGLEVSRTVIKGKILEMYPNSSDWISEDTRKEVIKILEKICKI